ncbi:DUF899 domain-containing protein [Pseudomonas vanderleydeniana]|uniref:Thioredoxin family protein n=1 Tax=Pseudomonas vanderleydeniana TaxID=2745495 RepID=A0A9E6PSF0_9PSED|nr:thioredoxin family protein [Pseudomonas vanderleydeniana]QXI31328.1 thioredoxin family protein [Pseudomonas vanderleydeniana]
MKQPNVEQHAVVSRQEWLAARREHLIQEKALSRQREQLNAARRALPWVRVDKDYRFDGGNGPRRLADLFGHNSQLVVYHFMFGDGWTQGCPNCSFLADHFDGANLHLAHHDVSFVVISHAPWAQFQPFRQRMGWRFEWLSSAGSDFNHDFGVSFTPEEQASGQIDYNYQPLAGGAEEMPGLSVFYRNGGGEIFHTYSTYARGLDILIGAHNVLDLTPKGRNEGPIMNWVRFHDRYTDSTRHSCCGSQGEQ